MYRHITAVDPHLHKTLFYFWHMHSQDIITHKLKITEVVKGIELVNKSTESIKVVLMME